MNTKHSTFSFLPDHFLGEKMSLSLENLHRLGSPKFLGSREPIISHFSLLGSCNGTESAGSNILSVLKILLFKDFFIFIHMSVLPA